MFEVGSATVIDSFFLGAEQMEESPQKTIVSAPPGHLNMAPNWLAEHFQNPMSELVHTSPSEGGQLKAPSSIDTYEKAVADINR
mmetsp:Transcript_7282/g.12041  ORF Transcript_7282/g.12041 Transcript_7282/m.12041 type:complete len:84 (+) Transcript_7282:475-726(+)